VVRQFTQITVPRIRTVAGSSAQAISGLNWLWQSIRVFWTK